jgi:quinol monooxygenase YgiN
MSTPLIAISTVGIKEGKLEDFTRTYKEVVETVREHEPRLIAFHGFVNKDGTEMTIIQVHPDTASMDLHMQVLRDKLGEHVARALGPDLIEPNASSITARPLKVPWKWISKSPGSPLTSDPRT